MVSDALKKKVLGLIQESSKNLGVKTNVTARIKDFMSLKVNIQSCSLDLKQNLIDTVKHQLEHGRLLGTEREYLESVLCEAERETDEPNHVHCSVHRLKKLFSGQSLELLEKIHSDIRCDYYCNSDVGRDYIDVAYYYDLTIGKNKTGFRVINPC